jgi:hypothetical protein
MRTEYAVVSDTEPFIPGFLDRLGDRVRLTDRGSGHVEALRLRPDLTASPLFEPAVRRRSDQLAGFLHPHFARVRQIGRLPAANGRLVIVSDAIDGWRLSEVLEAADQCGVAFHPDAVLFLLRQLLGAVASLHEVAPSVSHGALGTERLVVTAEGCLVVTESVLGGALRYLPPMPSDRLWRDLRLAVAHGEAQPFGRLTDLRQIGIVALSLALGRQLRRDDYPTHLASLLEESTPGQPGFGAEGLGPAVRGWLVRVLSLTDDLTPWSVAEARCELNRIVESDRRYAFTPTGLPALLGTVADYYAAAAEVPVPPGEPSAPTVIDVPRPVPEASEPAPEVSDPDLDVPQPVPDDSWPEATVRPAVDQLVDSNQETLAENPSAPMFAEQPSHLDDGVGRMADTLAAERPDVAADQGDLRLRHVHSPVGETSSRPLLGAHAAEDPSELVAAPSGRQIRTLIGIGAAALVIVALGGYALLRPSAITATTARRASSPPSMAVADTASATAAASAAAAPRAVAQPAPSTPRTPETRPPTAAPEGPAPTGTVEVVSPVSLNVSEGGRALGTSGESIKVPAGRHTLEIGREDLGFQAVQVVDVKPGQPHRIQPSLPSGVANLNATPWAEVWIDGRKVGETPLGHVQLTIGPHDVQFRHPELGDQSRTLVVTTGAIALLSVEMKK